MRVLVEIQPTVDTKEWSRLYNTGLVPDRVPYGLHHLADCGFSVLVRQAPRLAAVDVVSRIGGRLSGGARWPEGLLGRPFPSAADVHLCWDERTGIPAILSRVPGRLRRPVVTGALWLSDSDAKISTFASWIAGNALRHADAIFVNSSGQILPLREDWGVKAKRIHFIHFGVDTHFWDPTRSAVPADASVEQASPRQDEVEHPTIMSVGNDRHRNHSLLLLAVRDVRKRLPAVRLELVSREHFQVPVESGRWQQSLSHPQLRDLYMNANVVAVSTKPNNHASGLTAILEAMAMGKPVVATRTPGIADYVAHGETGLLVPPGNREAMAEALVQLLLDPSQCADFGAEARRRALKHFSTQAHARRLASILNSVT